MIELQLAQGVGRDVLVSPASLPTWGRECPWCRTLAGEKSRAHSRRLASMRSAAARRAASRAKPSTHNVRGRCWAGGDRRIFPPPAGSPASGADCPSALRRMPAMDLGPPPGCRPPAQRRLDHPGPFEAESSGGVGGDGQSPGRRRGRVAGADGERELGIRRGRQVGVERLGQVRRQGGGLCPLGKRRPGSATTWSRPAPSGGFIHASNGRTPSRSSGVSAGHALQRWARMLRMP